MLPQSRTLEEEAADKQRSARNGLALERGNGSALTGVQHVRGEKEPLTEPVLEVDVDPLEHSLL
jgi:hypothetical protein